MILQGKKNYLKVEEVKSGDIVKFINEGKWVESNKFKYDDGTPKKQLLFLVEFKGAEKDLSINTTSKNALIRGWGEDTEKWIGKEAKIDLVKQNVGGTLKNVIYLEPIENDVAFLDDIDEEPNFS